MWWDEGGGEGMGGVRVRGMNRVAYARRCLAEWSRMWRGRRREVWGMGICGHVRPGRDMESSPRCKGGYRAAKERRPTCGRGG